MKKTKVTKILSVLLLFVCPSIASANQISENLIDKSLNSNTKELSLSISPSNTSKVIGSDTQVASDQTFMRVKFGDGYTRPFFVAIFADHYRRPWYTYYTISKLGLEEGRNPTQAQLSHYFNDGDVSPWINLTPMIYADTGARLVIRTVHTYSEDTPKMNAVFEFATAQDEQSIVKTVKRESVPPYMTIIMPPNLSTSENIAKCRTDYEEAESLGQIADNTSWPTYGEKPNLFPFYVSARIDLKKMDSKVANRELKTLSNFGFNGIFMTDHKDKFKHYGFTKNHIRLYPLWTLKDNSSYLEPKVDEMKTWVRKAYNQFISDGHLVSDIGYCMLTDEPVGAKEINLVNDPVAAVKFREWLQKQGKTLSELFPGGKGNETWDMVKPVLRSEQAQYPALYYYTQKFRTYALRSFMQIQQELVHKTYGANFPVNVNFSDGPVYSANYYRQGVDYFELMETSNLNSIWGEDWANFASTYQCATFNVELLRSAAKRSNAHVGHHIIAYRMRKNWDIKLKIMGAVARSVKTLNNFYYGPEWAAHERMPWCSTPETWIGNAEITREIGWAEDLLYPAKTVKSEVAILYSSSADIWSLDKNHAYGFDRMHTWLALSHAQIPSDILSERDIEDGILDTYKVCYFSGTNLTQKATIKLMEWVNNGGILVLTAGAGMKDEYNQSNALFEAILPVRRAVLEELQPHLTRGRNLTKLTQKDYVTFGNSRAEVLSVRQRLTPNKGSVVLGQFSNKAPSIVKGTYGTGTIYCYGFLPSLSYIKEALVHRNAIEVNTSDPIIPPSDKYASEEELIGRSYNPWKYPKDIRDLIIKPVLENNVNIPLTCNTPLVDAVLMESSEGYVIPLSNYTLQPLSSITLNLKTSKKISRIETARQGVINYSVSNNSINFSLPLRDTDVIKIYFKERAVTENAADEKAVIAPNPAKKNFRINVDGDLYVYSLCGAKIKEIKNYTKETDVCVSGFPTGSYIVKVSNEDRTAATQLIKF